MHVKSLQSLGIRKAASLESRAQEGTRGVGFAPTVTLSWLLRAPGTCPRPCFITTDEQQVQQQRMKLQELWQMGGKRPVSFFLLLYVD